jgi:hypothetical protein
MHNKHATDDAGHSTLEFLALVPIIMFLMLLVGLAIRVQIAQHMTLGAARSAARAASIAGPDDATEAAETEVLRSIAENGDYCSEKPLVVTTVQTWRERDYVKVTVTCKTKPLGYGLKATKTESAEEFFDYAKRGRRE